MSPEIMSLLKQMIKTGNYAHFNRYFDSQLWYQVRDMEHSDGHTIGPEFPVPVSDIGTATFYAVDKAMLMMRYIRKHLEMLEEAKKEQES